MPPTEDRAPIRREAEKSRSRRNVIRIAIVVTVSILTAATASAQDDGDQCAGPRCVSAPISDDFSVDSSADYTGTADTGAGLPTFFTINDGGNGLLEITLQDEFYNVTRTNSDLQVGEAVSIDAPPDFGTLAGDSIFVTTGLTQPGTFGSLGLRMNRGPGATITVERFTSAGSSGAQDTGVPNPAGSTRVWIDRHDETTFRFYIGPESARVFVFEDTLLAGDLTGPLRVGVGAYNNLPTVFQFDNLSIACSPLSNACSFNATCGNTDPGYTCTCNVGFAGDGFTCTEICGDSLIVGVEECDPPSQQCCNASCFFEPDTLPCTGASQGGGCDIDADDHCEGTSTACIDVFQPDTYVCGPGSGDPNGTGFICDPEELCTGTSGICPPDDRASAGTVCNAGSGDPNGSGYICDPDEVCPGTPQGACPADAFDSFGAVCNPGAGPTGDGGSTCDPDEVCPGVANFPCPADIVYPDTVMCNPGSENPNGGAVCDPDEYCTGVADVPCPADTVLPADTLCRQSIGECDYNEVCSGVANEPCAADAFFADATACYTDPWLEDPPLRTPPASLPLPCVFGDCVCSIGLCIEPDAMDVKKAKLEASKFLSDTGKGVVLAEIRETDTLLDLGTKLLAGSVSFYLTDGDASFSLVQQLTTCEPKTKKTSADPFRYKCQSTNGRVIIRDESTDTVPAFRVKAVFKKLSRAIAGTDNLEGPITAALVGDDFYRVDFQDNINEDCIYKGGGTGKLICNAPVKAVNP